MCVTTCLLRPRISVTPGYIYHYSLRTPPPSLRRAEPIDARRRPHRRRAPRGRSPRSLPRGGSAPDERPRRTPNTDRPPKNDISEEARLKTGEKGAANAVSLEEQQRKKNKKEKGENPSSIFLTLRWTPVFLCSVITGRLCSRGGVQFPTETLPLHP